MALCVKFEAENASLLTLAHSVRNLSNRTERVLFCEALAPWIIFLLFLGNAIRIQFRVRISGGDSFALLSWEDTAT